MNDENEVFADVNVEGKNPFDGLGEEKTPAESQTAKEPKEEEPDQGKKNTDEDLNIPFHKHPRWIERENELKTLKERDEARDREISDLREKFKQTESSDKSKNTKIANWFTTLYGDNVEAWEQYSEHDKASREEIKNEILEAQRQEVEKAQEQEKYWNNWVEQEMSKLESKGYKFERNELANVILKTRPTDDKGNLDFEAGYETLMARKGPQTPPPLSQARKQIADTVTKSTRGEPSKKDYKTSADLRYRKWGDMGTE